MTDEERKAADRDASVGEWVHAPASERVPRTVAGYGDVVEHVDTATPERQAAAYGDTTTEPSFARVQQPNSPTTSPPMSESANPPQPSRWMSSTSNGMMVPMIGWASLGICAGIGVWLWMRWQRERNRPINRIRRQAYALRDRMPDEFPEEATRPAIGLGTALLGIGALAWQQYQARSRSRTRDVRRMTRGRADKASAKARWFGRQAAQTIEDVDWQQRLMGLRERWTPARIDLEKVSMPKR